MQFFVDDRLNVPHPDRTYMDGQWVTLASDRALEVIYPATEEVVARVPEATVVDVDRAVAAARRAFDEGPWPRMTAVERGRILRAISKELAARADDIAKFWTLQMGAPLSFARYGAYAGGLFAHYADLAETFAFEDVRPRENGVGIVVHEPVGVVAAVLPWNASFHLSCMKLAAAFAAGCTVVYKPAPETPLDAVLIAEAAEKAGLPAGVLNIVAAGREVGDHLIRHPGVDKVSFTGSTAAGRHIGMVCAERFTRCTLELGGKSAAIILDDMPMEDVLPVLLPAAIGLSGQMCAALTRVVVSKKRKKEFIDAATAAFRTVKIGDPFDEQTFVGPVAMKRQYERVLGYIERAQKDGARLISGGRRAPGFNKGYYIEPTLVEATNDMEIAREEIFGPVVCIIACDDEEDAIRIANDSPYGLSGTVFTRDDEKAYAIARRIRSGNFNQNGWTIDSHFPFGGFKQSGVGRENGLEGLASYLEIKSIFMPRAPKLFGR